MALSGYAVPVVCQQMGIHYQQCREFFNLLSHLGWSVELKQRIKTSAMLMRNREGKILASSFMLVYSTLGEHSADAAIEQERVEAAFVLYQIAQEELQLTHRKSMHTINDAWSIVCEYRANQSYIRRCPHCRLAYLSTEKQYTTVDCPFCPPSYKH